MKTLSWKKRRKLNTRKVNVLIFATQRVLMSGPGLKKSLPVAHFGDICETEKHDTDASSSTTEGCEASH